MIPPELAHIVLPIIVAASILLMLLRPRGIAEVYWIGGGALLLIAFGLVPLPLAGHAIAEGADVYLFLIGMMLLSELAREHGVFDWLSSQVVGNAQGSAARLFSLVYFAGTAVTILMSNDATAVVLTPAILHATSKAKVPPLPYLFACALIANAASFVLPISNPANLVVFHGQMPPLAQWLASYAIPSALSILATYAVLRWLFRADLQSPLPRLVTGHDFSRAEKSTQNAGALAPALTTQGKLVLAGLAATAAVLLIASSLGKDLGLPTCLAALAVTGLVSILARSNPWPLAKHMSWSTIALVGGLFILVRAVESVGALTLTQQALHWAQTQSPAAGALVTGFAVAIANNLINNLPLGLIAGSTLQAAHAHGLLADAVLIGVDLGPNLSITGSLATILWLLALRREDLQVSFWSFLRVGAIAMPISLLAALSGSILMRAIF
jgi:arsenical pump membrane protein